MSAPPHFPVTPDGRYFVVHGRLRRLSNPALSTSTRDTLVHALMNARRAVATARRRTDACAERAARKAVGEAKLALGERGPVWWTDGAPDFNRHLVDNTPYAKWYASLASDSATGCPAATPHCDAPATSSRE